MILIYPDKLTKELERRKLSTGRLVQWAAAMDAASVEIVTCGECARCVMEDDGIRWCEHVRRGVTDDWWCKDGVRAGCTDACEIGR